MESHGRPWSLRSCWSLVINTTNWLYIGYLCTRSCRLCWNDLRNNLWIWQEEISISHYKSQYIPGNIHTVHTLLCFVMVWHWLIPPMMTSSKGNIFCVTDPLWGEFTGHRWIPLTKASGAELWCFQATPEKTIDDNRDAGDLRRHRANYDVTVMQCQWSNPKEYE